MVAEVPVSTPAGAVRVGSVLDADAERAADVVTALNAVRVGTAGAVTTAPGVVTGAVDTLPPLHATTNDEKIMAPIAIDVFRTSTIRSVYGTRQSGECLYS
jgi:hypothetical protein